MESPNETYKTLIDHIGGLLVAGREKAARAVNSILVETYWRIGKYIVEYEQQGNEKAEYGSQLLEKLSKDLTEKHGKGFGKSNLFQMRLFYIRFPIFQTVSGKLTWSHYAEILRSDNDLEISFYSRQCEKEGWSVRELRRQKDSMLFHRLALSKNKEGVLKMATKGHEVQDPEDLIKDPFVLEFLQLPERQEYFETELEKKLIDNLQQFLLELGKGFAFIGRQYRINVGGTHFRIDLLFYHRILKCFILIDLKKGKLDHTDVGQMNFYLNYFKAEESMEDDNEPIGILLGTEENHVLIKYALGGITNKILLAKYQTFLPDKEQLEKALNKLFD
jgi:predicted nuclease of restriction endonuclease-like (RecB) superfamily